MKDTAREEAMISGRIILDAYDALRLEDAQKAALWDRITAAANEASTDSGTYSSDSVRHAETAETERAASALRARVRRCAVRRLAAVTAVLVIALAAASFALSGIGAVVEMTGHVYAGEARDTGMGYEELLVNTADPLKTSETYIYAPAVYYLDENRLIFGNDTGLVIYSLREKRIEALVDMQSICSGYYNCDSMDTHVFADEDELFVYNTKLGTESETPFGWYHIFDLSEAGHGKVLGYSESGNDTETLDELSCRCSEYESEHFSDTWDSFAYLTESGLEDSLASSGGCFSRKCFTRSIEGGKETSILVWRGWDTDGEEDGAEAASLCYELCTVRSGGDGGAVFTAVELGIDDELRAKADENNHLPAYAYEGGDQVMRAVCAYMTEMHDPSEPLAVLIPEPVILGRVQDGDELLVFGNFWSDTYVKRGNTLVNTSGGEMPACMHLVKNGAGYTVTKIEAAEDGDGYLGSIRDFTKGHPLIRLRLRLSGTKSREKARRSALQDYVKLNSLGIDYYKDYEWDPVPLFDD